MHMIGAINVSPNVAAVHPLLEHPIMLCSLLHAQALVHSHIFNNGE